MLMMVSSLVLKETKPCLRMKCCPSYLLCAVCCVSSRSVFFKDFFLSICYDSRYSASTSMCLACACSIQIPKDTYCRVFKVLILCVRCCALGDAWCCVPTV